MDGMGNETSPEAVGGLRAARKEMAAARRAAKATAKPAAKKAAPKATATSTKLKWQFPEGFEKRGETGQSAALGGGELAMRPVDGGWTATFTKDGNVTVLLDKGARGAAYRACTQHAKGAGK
jgi:hypothetical protein